MNEDTGKKLLIGGGVVALGAIIWNQIYTSGFQDGLMAAGAPAGEWNRYHGPGFPFGLLLLLGLGFFIYSRVRNGRGGPGFNLGWGGRRRGFYDDRRQPWQPPQGPDRGPGRGGHFGHFGHQPFGAPAQPNPGQPNAQAQPGAGYGYPQPPQPPVNGGAAAPPPPAPPAPAAPQPGPGAASQGGTDPNQPII